ncbi:hypothetical protein BB469_05735 [Helicobacter pylori]|nr:hypothetical protein BB469_05735 [Helicobacter pylori]
MNFLKLNFTLMLSKIHSIMRLKNLKSLKEFSNSGVQTLLKGSRSLFSKRIRVFMFSYFYKEFEMLKLLE